MTKEEPRLVKWYDSGFPPIDLNENVSDVTELIRAYKALQKDTSEVLERLEKEIESRLGYCDERLVPDVHKHLKEILSLLSTIKSK